MAEQEVKGWIDAHGNGPRQSKQTHGKGASTRMTPEWPPEKMAKRPQEKVDH